MIFNSIGIAYALKGDSINSKEYLKRRTEIDPDRTPIYVSLGDIELLFRKNYRKAVYYYQKALEEENWHPALLFYHNVGMAKANLGDTLGALKAYEKAIRLDSNNVIGYESRVNLLSSLNLSQYIKKSSLYDSLVIHDLTEMIRLYWEDSVQTSLLYMARAAMHSRSPKTINMALEDLNRAISFSPNTNAYPYFARATLRLVLSNGSRTKEIEDKVLKDIGKAIGLDQGLWESYIVKASVLKDFDHNLKASCDCVKTAIKMGGAVPRFVKKYLCKGKIVKKFKINDYILNPIISSDHKGFNQVPSKKN